MEEWQYYGLFLDKDTRDKLISFLENSKWDYLYEELSKIYLDHCTLLHQAHLKEDSFKSISIKEWLDVLLEFGITQKNILITHIGYSNKSLAFKVILNSFDPIKYPICFNETPHITIDTYEDGKSVDSNSITEWYKIKPIKITANLKRV